MNEDAHIDRANGILECVLNDAQNTAGALAEAAAQILSGQTPTPGSGLRLSGEHRRALQTHIQVALQLNPWCNGAGFASYAAPAGLDDGYWTLEWWQQEGPSMQQAQLDRNQETRRRLDFRAFAWFDQPARCLRPVVEGPYVDYICNGAYTITAAHPVLVQGACAGVTAVDVLVATLDRMLLPALHPIGKPALVLNADSRVVMSTAHRIRPGSLWRPQQGDRLIGPARALRLAVLAATPLRSVFASPRAVARHSSTNSPGSQASSTRQTRPTS
ncbi:cache domain-containing protein [Achromobacter spanius]|uniref:cache domain-containing protein n=1 Tax=Achromobacter spanius TaxID=217203 RepID=UPI002226982D|nr:cache domain-containing protein [Achromobacter spanius]MCW3154529.1 cache domain-containing protein [Achromobacter spanius]